MSIEAEKRKREILQMINSKGQVKTAELAAQMGVSTETIRRYFKQLEQDNNLKMVYGGAVKLSFDKKEPDHLKREVLHQQEKNVIARQASNLIEDDDVIAVDEGTTTFQLINYMMYKDNLTVISSSLPLVSELINYKNEELFSGDIILIGGKIDSKHKRSSGSIAVKMMDYFHIDKAFISTSGILNNHGLTAFEIEKGMLSQKYIEQAAESIVMADYSKVGKKKHFKFSSLKAIDKIICEKIYPADWEQSLKRENVEWITAE